MEFILEQAKLVYPGHPLDGKRLNVKIKDGVIHSLDAGLNSKSKIIRGGDLHFSIGWFDIGTFIGEPGFEHRETSATLTRSALAGGYTGVAVFPNTKPCLHSKAEIEFIIQKSRSSDIDILPIGAITKQCKGQELAEMIDMHHSGAIAFSDGTYPVQDNGVMVRAMRYVNHFDGLIINGLEDNGLASLGQMHEGMISQQLGLKGIPAIAESLMLQRDLYLSQYAGSRYLAHLVSTEEAIKLLKALNKNKSMVQASVSYLNLLFDDTQLTDFDSHYKQSPPLRSVQDRKALVKAVKDKVVGIICSNHQPLEIEKKDLEFAYADPGTIGLQTIFPALSTARHFSMEEWVTAAAINPRTALKVPLPELATGARANLTFFDPEQEWTYEKKDIHSLSKNSLFLDQTFKGKVLGTIHKGKLHLNK